MAPSFIETRKLCLVHCIHLFIYSTMRVFLTYNLIRHFYMFQDKHATIGQSSLRHCQATLIYSPDHALAIFLALKMWKILNACDMRNLKSRMEHCVFCNRLRSSFLISLTVTQTPGKGLETTRLITYTSTRLSYKQSLLFCFKINHTKTLITQPHVNYLQIYVSIINLTTMHIYNISLIYNTQYVLALLCT